VGRAELVKNRAFLGGKFRKKERHHWGGPRNSSGNFGGMAPTIKAGGNRPGIWGIDREIETCPEKEITGERVLRSQKKKKKKRSKNLLPLETATVSGEHSGIKNKFFEHQTLLQIKTRRGLKGEVILAGKQAKGG